VAREGTTDTMTSEAKCAIRATVRHQVSNCWISSLRCSQNHWQDHGGDYVRRRTSLSSSLDGRHVDCEIDGGRQWRSSLQGRPEDVLTLRLVGDRPQHTTGSGNWQWDNFSQRDVTTPARNCVIDASAISGSGSSSSPVAAYTNVIDISASQATRLERIGCLRRDCRWED
jgi:hypothetical protein